MSFGISSAPDAWQRKMQETIEGLFGAEVTDRCRERNLVLNAGKVRYKLEEVSFMRCLLTDEGMKSDPKKVEAVFEMPMPTDVEGVRRLIGTVQYLN